MLTSVKNLTRKGDLLSHRASWADGNHVATTGKNQPARLWRLEPRQLLQTDPLTAEVVFFTDDGNTIVAATGYPEYRVFGTWR